MAEALLEVRDLKKYFPVAHGMFTSGKGMVHAVDGVSFSIQQGETFGLVGESGCGKSSLSRVVLGLLKPDGGSLTFDGRPVEQLDRVSRMQLRMVFQNPYGSLNPKEKVFDIIAEPYRIARGYSSEQIRQEVTRLADQVGLTRAQLECYPHQFSGGQRQRIGIARAIAVKPRLVVCDEPVSALDVSIQAQVLNLLQDIQKEYGLSYLFISHNLNVVKYMASRIAVMYLGKIMEIAPAEQLYSTPAHPYTKALLSAIPGMRSRLNMERIVLHGEIPSPVEPPSGCRFRTRCPYAQPRCAQEEPQLRPVGEGHMAACHFCGEEEQP